MTSVFAVSLGPALAQLPVIVNEPEPLALPIGSAAFFSVSVFSSTPLSFQWYRGTQQVVGATLTILNIPNITPAQAGNYFAIASNIFGSVTSAPASLVVLPIMPGMVDPAFNVGLAPNGAVRTVKLEPGGQVYIGGDFTTVNGANRSRLARLNLDGLVDGSFVAGVSNSFNSSASVYALAVQTNQQIIVGGYFAYAVGQLRQNLARINANGTLDNSFNAGLNTNGSVWAMAIQSDGKILIGGDFTNVLGVSRSRIARLNNDGTLDGTFAPGLGMNDSVRAIVVQPDGAIIVGGAFTGVDTQLRNRIVRLTSTGAPDPAFNSAAGANGWVNAIALQSDGKIILGGSFVAVNGELRQFLARLDSNGFLDTAFAATNLPNGFLTSLAVQPDGKVIIGGGFTALGSIPRANFARLTSDGSIDEAFYAQAGANSWVESIALDSGGAIYLGGAFFSVNGLVRSGVARLFGGEPVPFAPIFTAQPVRQLAVGEGDHFQLYGEVLAFPATAYHWMLNGTNLPGAYSPLLLRNNVRLAQAGNYALIASNSVGSTTSRVSVVTIFPARVGPGALDINFYTGTGPDSDVRSIAVQTNGQAVIGGWFYFVDATLQPFLARLETDGSLDPDFTPTLDSIVTRVGLSPSNSIGVSGYFSAADGMPNNAFALYNTNGALMPGYSSSISPFYTAQTFAFQSRDQAIVAGYFIAANTVPFVGRTNLARLNANGSVDATFDAFDNGSLDIAAVAIDTDRKVLIAGGFSSVQGVPRRGIARLNYYGDLDLSFNPGSGADGRVTSVVVQPDGKILVAGQFRAFNGVPRHQIARLNADGTLDMSFEPGPGANSAILALQLQSSGKILIGGGFYYVNTRYRPGIARLNRDGSLDLSFDPGDGANLEVNSIAELPDGKVLIGGAFTSFDGLPRPHIARLQAGVPAPSAPAIVFQSDEKTVQAGEDVTFYVEASGFPEPTYQWQFFGTNIPGATTWVLTLRNVRSFAAGNYTVIVSNSLNSIVSAPIPLEVIAPSRAAGSPDISFYTGRGPNDRVHAIAVQGDKRIIIGGAFTEISGLSRHRIARLMHDGSVDSSFNPGLGASDRVMALAIQPDGRILAAGNFTNFNGGARNRIVRLETNGAVDLSFNAGMGADYEILAVAVQTNGQILIGGQFSHVAGQIRFGLARLHANGDLDAAFLPGLSGSVYALAVQPDGNIDVGGQFGVHPESVFNFVRLTFNGALDPGFNYPGVGGVYAVSLDRSNRMILGGEFFSIGGTTQTRVGRLLPTGSRDTTFTNAGVNGAVWALAAQPDDKVVIGGTFRSIGNFPYLSLIYRDRLARLNDDSSVDLSFGDGSGIDGGSSYIDEYGEVEELTTVLAIAREADGKILVGGDFTTVNGIARPYIARVFGREASAAVAVHKGQGTVELIWDTGILQVANQITGPWTDLPDAQSPLLYSTGGAQQFFRLKFN